MLTTLMGILGAFFFGICAFPQVIHVWRTQNTESLSKAFLVTWALGEGCMWTYVCLQNASSGIIQWPLHANYFLNALGLIYLLYKKLKEKQS